MLFLENIRLALSSLKANKMRSLLTMLGIIIGIASVIAIMTVGNSLTASMNDSMLSMGANNVDVYLMTKETEDEVTEEGHTFKADSGNPSIEDEDLISKEMIDNYVETYPEEIMAISVSEQVGGGSISIDKKTASVTLQGESAGYFAANNVKLLAGRAFTAQEMEDGRMLGIISSKASDKLFESYEDAVGQTVSVSMDSKDIAVTVIGVYEDTSAATGVISISFDFLNSASVLHIPFKAARSLTHSEGYSHFSVVTKPGVNPDDFAAKTKSFFKSYYKHNRKLDVDAMSMASLVETMSGMLDKITTAISVIAGIALLVGGIGVMNIMLVSITERTREIGTRKALGAPNSSIRTQFIVEAVIICLIGGMIGVSLGLGLGSLAAKLMQTPASPSLKSILGSLFFSMGIGIFFGYYPANKAAKMDPIEALRYE